MKEFDAFISYETSSGKSTAEKLCNYLEKGGLKCWIAPRDIQYGHVYAGVISGAIKNSEFIVCVYTENYNSSNNVKREVEIANANRISILPLITCDVPFDADLEYYFAAHQQIRVSKNNLEQGFDDVLKTIQRVVKKEQPCVTAEPNSRKETFTTPEKKVQGPRRNVPKKRVIMYASIAAAVVILAAILLLIPRHTEGVNEEEEVIIENVLEERLTFCVNDVEFTVRLINDTMYAGETEVTQGLWETLMGSSIEEQRDKANPEWTTRGTGKDYPMYYVNLAECREFASLLSDVTGKRFELPTESEWEMCVAKDGGASSTEDSGWYAENSGECVHPVGEKKANGLGLYDMSGNVSEWCDTKVEGDKYVCRGGDWCMPVKECSVNARDNCDAGMRRSSLGFRIVMKTDK